jgi:hypothetical protein
MGSVQFGFLSELGTGRCGGGDAAEKSGELSGGFDRRMLLGYEFLDGHPVSRSK